jgi:hypothetical protein
MANTLRLTIDWRDPASELPESQQEAVTQTLFQELQALDEVARVERVADPDAPEGGMGAQWLWSILTAEITVEGIKTAAQEAYARIPGKPISFTVEVDGQKSNISAENVSPKEFDVVLAKLVEASKQIKDA